MSYKDRFYAFMATESENSGQIEHGLIKSHTSEEDAYQFVEEMEKVYANLDDAKESMYAAASAMGGTNTPGSPGFSSGGFHGIDFFDAQITAEIKSYTGIFSMERHQEHPNASIAYFNLYGIKSNTTITPNIGVGRVFHEGVGDVVLEVEVEEGNIGNEIKFGATESGTAKMNSIPVVPGTMRIEVTNMHTNKTEIITDSGSGYLLGFPGLVTANNIDYGHSNNTPKVEFTLGGASTLLGTTSGKKYRVKLEYTEDTPKVQDDRIKAEVEYFTSKTAPIQVPYEVNQVTAAAAKKSLGMDIREFTINSVTSEYTKILNHKVDKAIERSAKVKNERIIDLSQYSLAAGQHKSLAESFLVQLSALDTAMSIKAEKANEVTAYLVSIAASDVFRTLDGISAKWVPNKGISYINDIIGYLDGVPVVRSKYILDPGTTSANDGYTSGERTLQGYAIHKHASGKIAPLMRGMYLPLTTMNEVGNFDNPLIKTGGVFSYEGVDTLTQDLTIGFQIKVGTASNFIPSRG